jgi:F-type H+-transporting ATPase subunit b
MHSRIALHFAAVVAMIAPAVFASLPAVAAEGGGGGLPQLNIATFPAQLVWLAIIFAALYVLMTRVALPRVGEVLEARQERLTDDLEKAQALRDEAQALIEAYEKALSDARGEAQRVAAAVAAEIKAAGAERQTALQAELTARVVAAEARIAEAKSQALANVRDIAAEVAVDVAQRVAGVSADPAAAQAAVTGALASRSERERG